MSNTEYRTCALVHFALEWSMIAIKAAYSCLLLFSSWIFLCIKHLSTGHRRQMSAMASGPFVTEKTKSGVSAVVSAICAFPLLSGGVTGSPGLRWAPRAMSLCRLCHLPSLCSPSSLQENTTVTLQVLKCTAGWHSYKKIKKVGCITRIVTSQP